MVNVENNRTSFETLTQAEVRQMGGGERCAVHINTFLRLKNIFMKLGMPK